ncbi:type I-F CRISPR-associated protein Csy1 [Arsenophonus apicola]|uniref:Type I-F CRISPR-associated protein Csy1 n=1 Tax=Arsenophonus apicola TaxID=2879119 RepID=A0ABY8P0P2_9GAMM|nr:type I-F CRISPR-associated protein Csy1 [Arsenophonus apicola]WGO83052.1 type I-F CRISPR-associated protein Csy1 [Arsenophonus apicola]
MLDPAIEDFFTERKAGWLKGKLKTTMSEDEINAIKQECEAIFTLSEWLISAAKRAGQISITTHPCTFSHPSARKNKNGYVSSIIATAKSKKDGFLRTGNVNIKPDAFGNAAALDVYKFLTLEMNDKQTLLEHIKAETELARTLLGYGKKHYEELRDGFLQMIKTDNNVVITSSKIKQVYFPIETEYHQLSLLTHSGHLFELRQRIDAIRFAEQNKTARELKRKGEYSEHGFSEIYNITTIGFGGTKPQNISVKNSQNSGKAHLLLSLPPPILLTRTLRLPQHNFFSDTFNPFHIKETFQAFHRLLYISKNKPENLNNQQVSGENQRYKPSRDTVYDILATRVQEYIDHIILIMWQIRQQLASNEIPLPKNLPTYQKIWLFPDRQDERDQTNDWLTHLIEVLARQFISSYQKIIEKKYIQLGDAELKKIIQLVVENNKESLR